MNSWPPSNSDSHLLTAGAIHSPSRSPRASTRDIEMAPKKDKSKVEDEAVANLSTGWRKSKMSESAVQDLENMGLLQTQGIVQWRAGKEKITL